MNAKNLVLVVAIVGGWAYLQLQPKDITAARERWTPGMSADALDQTARDLVSRMSLDEKLDQIVKSTRVPWTTCWRKPAATS